jgi:hypothetical protein
VRAVVWFCLVSGPLMMFGWPNHWIVLAAAFAAGMLAEWHAEPVSRRARPGYVHPPSELNDSDRPLHGRRPWIDHPASAAFDWIPGRNAFAKRYPIAAATLEALAEDPAVTPELFERVAEAIFDVADRHVDHEPVPRWR